MNIRHSLSIVMAGAMMLVCSAAWSIPVLNGGWDTTDSDGSGYTDHINAIAPALNVGGAYNYSLGSAAIFRITDVLNTGDIWVVYDMGAPILTTTLQSFATGFGDNAEADAAWVSGIYTKGELFLAAGDHSITVSGNGQGGLPAHYFARIDSVPEPVTLSLLGIGLAGVGFSRRRMKA